MALELIAAITLAFGVAGLVLLARKLSGGRIPKIALPASIACALIAFAIWGDYSWASRTEGALPERLTVIDELPQSNLWRPWTYVVPVTERIVAVDRGGAMRNEALPGTVLVDLVFMERRAATRQLPMLVDCQGNRSAIVSDPAALSPESVADLDWAPLPADSRLAPAVCTA
ncbi:MAG: hypothetical protein VYD57_00150 [Pseudomonadota bacterium]|nr:hypothetical protein [Pseudomonadota bacterium]